jgi:hypothetical protein
LLVFPVDINPSFCFRPGREHQQSNISPYQLTLFFLSLFTPLRRLRRCWCFPSI